MAKTLAQIRTAARQIIFQTDSGTSNFTDAQLAIWANDAYRRIATALESLPITSRDYTAASGNISLNTATISVKTAKILNNATSDFEPLECISIDELFKIDPNFENADTGAPKCLARTGVFTMRLHPPPNTDYNSQTLRLVSLENPTELSSDSDTPDLPGNMHDIIAHWIASQAFFAIGRSEDAVAQLTLFRGALKEMKGVSVEFSPSRGQFKFEPGDHDLD